MKANGAEVIHLATGFIVGYQPCPYVTHFEDYIRAIGPNIVRIRKKFVPVISRVNDIEEALKRLDPEEIAAENGKPKGENRKVIYIKA